MGAGVFATVIIVASVVAVTPARIAAAANPQDVSPVPAPAAPTALPSNCVASTVSDHTVVTCTWAAGPADGADAFWTWTVPASVRRVHVELAGGQGGDGSDLDQDSPGQGGSGGQVGADVAVTEGQVFSIAAGRKGAVGSTGGGWPDGGPGGERKAGNSLDRSGCGGGGSSRILPASGAWILIAAGGGGCGGKASGHYGVGGGAGGEQGQGAPDVAWQQDGTLCSAKGLPGGGASSGDVGRAGAMGQYSSGSCQTGATGQLSTNGQIISDGRSGGLGGEAQGNRAGGGGGGGGGYYGGGGGGGGNDGIGGFGGGGGGGGGANHVPSNPEILLPTQSTGTNLGDGWARITYTVANPTVSLSVQPLPGNYGYVAGTPITLSATVRADSANVPTGDISFDVESPTGTAVACGAPLTVSEGTTGQGTGSCTYTPTHAGTLKFTAHFDGNDAVAAGSSSTYIYPTKMATATTLEASPSGDVLTAIVTGNSAVVPFDGRVDFVANGAAVSSCTEIAVVDNHDGTAQASCEVARIAGSEVDYVAAYSGDANTAASTSAPLHQSVVKAPTETTVTLDAATLSFGQAVTATATIAPLGTEAALDGTVDFVDTPEGAPARTVCAAVPVDGLRQASCSWLPGGGKHRVIATYSGGTQADGSTSLGSATLTVAKVAPALGLAANPPGGSISGKQVTLSVSVVVAGAPMSQGAATFLDGGVPVAGCVATPVISGVATCSMVPTAGDHTFSVATSGTADLLAGTAILSGGSPIYHVGLLPSTTAVALTSPSPAPSTIPAGTPITVKVTANAGGVTPTGSVALGDNGQPIAGCSAQPLVGGIATCTWVPSAGVVHVVNAAYTGDTVVASSATTAPLSFTVGRFMTSAALVVSPGGSTDFGTQTTLTATVTTAGPIPTGTMTFTDGGVTIASCGMPAAPVATCTFQASPGTHRYRAVYVGDVANAPSTTAEVGAATRSLATVASGTARQASQGALSLSGNVVAPTGPSLHPTGTITFAEAGTPVCTATLEADPTGGSSGTCQTTADAEIDHTFSVTYSPGDPAAFDASSATVDFAAVAACSTELSAFVSRFTGSGPKTISAGTLGSVTVTPAGPVGPCDTSTSLGVSVDASLFNGTLRATGVTGSITAGGGFCLDSGVFRLPDSWHVPTVAITAPICFTLTDTGSISGIASGGLTAATTAGTFPFVAFPNAPPASVSLGFTTDLSGTTLRASFLAGEVDNPTVALGLEVASDGKFAGTLTTPGLTVLGQSLADLIVTVTGGGGEPLRFDGGVTLGPIHVAPGLMLSTVAVTVSTDGFTVAGTADVGVAGHVLTLDVAGDVHSGGDWSLTLASSGGPLWEPVSGLQIEPDLTGTVTSSDGVVAWSVTAGGTALATWNPAPGAKITLDQVSLASSMPACPSVPEGADDLALSFGGTLSLNGVDFAVEGCVDLTLGTFHLEAAGQSVAVTAGLMLTDAHLRVDASVSGAFNVSGGATATVTAGGHANTLAVDFDFSSDGTLVIGGSVDLTSWGAPVKGYVAYASSSVNGFDTTDPTVGESGRIDLAAGLTAAAVWTPSAGTAEVLAKAGFTLGAGGTVDLAATLAPTRAVTFHAALAAPEGMPFLKLPGGATVTGASLDFADGTLTLVADATVPMPGGAAPAVAHLEVTVGGGTFDGSATLDGLVLFGQTVNLSGAVTGTRPNGTLVVKGSVTAHLPGPVVLPGASSVTLSDVTLTLGTDGIEVAATVDLAGRGGMTVSGTFESVTAWSLTVTSTPLQWTPAPGFTLTAQFSGTIARTESGVVFDVSASNPTGDLATFTPVDGFTLAVHGVRLGNGPTRPTGCRVAAGGNVWLYVDGSAVLSIGSTSGSAAASGCFDLTAGQVSLTADASQMQLSLLNGSVVVSGPKVTVSRTSAGYAVDASVDFQVRFPSGPMFAQTATLSLRSGGTFIVGVRTNLSNWLGSAGGSAYLYYSSAAVNGYDTGDPTVGAVDLVSGITFAVKLTLPGNVADELATIGLTSPGGATLTAIGTLDFARSVYSLKIRFDAGLAGQELFKTDSGVSLALDSGYLKLTVSSGSVVFGLGLQATLHVPSADASGPGSDVGLVGEITISTAQLAVSLQLGDCHSGPGWLDAFGVEGLTVQCAALRGGLSLQGPPLPTFGMMGTVTSLPSNVADTIGFVNGTPMSFALNLLPFLLSISIGTVDSPDVALRPLTMQGLPDAMEVRYAGLYISPTGATIGQESFPAGFGFGFQASVAGVTVSVLAHLDPKTMTISFDGNVSQFSVGPLSIGPVSLHFKASPRTFEFTFDGALMLGPGEVDLGIVRIGGSLGASVHLAVSPSGISAWFTGTASVYIAAYLPHATCYYDGYLPHPCDWWWDQTGFSITLGRTGFSLAGGGLTVTFDGYSLTLPFDGGGATTSRVAFGGATPAPVPTVWRGTRTPSPTWGRQRPLPDRLLRA